MIKFEAARLHFLSDVFVAVAVVVSGSRDFKIQRRDGNESVAKKVNLRSFVL